MTTTTQFEELQFSILPHGDSSWIQFLRTLLPLAESRVVFTHGDYRAANSMVDMVESRRYFVTGVIDWESRGFYPEYFEFSRVLYLNASFETDWWRNIPACIAPAMNRERWLVGRRWDQYVNSN
jgi:aminoglycoside phosphotransferase (APT) family kinase protein